MIIFLLNVQGGVSGFEFLFFDALLFILVSFLFLFFGCPLFPVESLVD